MSSRSSYRRRDDRRSDDRQDRPRDGRRRDDRSDRSVQQRWDYGEMLNESDYRRLTSLMTQTFARIPNSIRGLAIGRKGAIQKLVTGRSSRDVGFILDRYIIVDDDAPDHFKIIIRGTPRAVLCAQRFIFNHIRESHKKARDTVLNSANILWNYDDGLKSFVMHLISTPQEDRIQKMLARANPHGCAVPPPLHTGGARPGSPAFRPSSPTYVPDDVRPRTPPGPPPGTTCDRSITITDNELTTPLCTQ